MKQRYQLVIFDLDGTLLDTLDDLWESVNAALSTEQLPKRTREEIRRFVGNGIRKLIERSVPDGTDSAVTDRVFEAFQKHYKEHCADKTRPYDGILELLRSLRKEGIRTAVVSNKADFAVKDLCRIHFSGMLSEAIGERSGIARKPAPDTVNEVLRLLNEDRTKAVYVGDSDVDVQTAANAGMDCIAVTWGFRDADVLRNAGAKTIVSDAKALAEAIGIENELY